MSLPLPQLNLPPAQLRVEYTPDGHRRIWDSLRQKLVALTPEEWVRQNFVADLTGRLGYPPALMANEVAITLNGTSRRCDTVVYTPSPLAPLMIVEYKAPAIRITQRTFNQIARYNIALRTPWLVVSNGLQHFCCHINLATGKHHFLSTIPPYSALAEL